MASLMVFFATYAQAPSDGGVWKDNNGVHINVHGGNIMLYKGTLYFPDLG